MKKPRDIAVLIMMAIILTLSCCVSCKTSQPEVVTEYVPMSINIRPDIEVLFDARPNDAEEMKLIPKDNVKTSIALLYNSYEYQKAWERWSEYAIGLEDYLENLADQLEGPKA